MLPDYFEFSLPTRVIYGIGVIDQLDDAVAHYDPRRALLVTDAILGFYAQNREIFESLLLQ